MLRRSLFDVGTSVLCCRPLLQQNLRLASSKAEKAKAKVAPAKRDDHNIARHAPRPHTSGSSEPKWKSYTTPTMRFVKWFSVSFLAFHVCTEYFYVVSDTYGISMLPTLNSTGDWLLISKYHRRGRGIEVGDLVSFKHPLHEEEFAVKRVMGLEGDFVLMNTPEKSAAMIQVPEGHCWVVGDDLPHSRDSRMFGPLPMALIAGKPIMRIITGMGWLPSFSMIGEGLQDGDEADNPIE